MEEVEKYRCNVCGQMCNGIWRFGRWFHIEHLASDPMYPPRTEYELSLYNKPPKWAEKELSYEI